MRLITDRFVTLVWHFHPTDTCHFIDRRETLEILLINYVVNVVHNFFVVAFVVSTACDVTGSLQVFTSLDHCAQTVFFFFFCYQIELTLLEDKEMKESSQLVHFK